MAILALLLKLALAPAAVVFLTLTINTIRGVIAHRVKHRAFRSVRGPARTSLAAGNLQELYGPDGLPFYESLSSYGGVAKVHGLFGDVFLSITDPRALAHLLVQDANNFPAADVSGPLHMHRYLTGPGLLATNGAVHRRQRKLLNPVFSPGQIKRLAPLMRDISRQLRDLLVEDVTRSTQESASSGEIDLANWFGRVGLEMISQAGFGHTFHSLEGNGDDYVSAVKDVIPSLTALGPLIPPFVLSGAVSLPPRLLHIAGRSVSRVLPPLRRFMRIVDLMYEKMHTICEERKASASLKGAHANSEQGNIIEFLLQASGESHISNDVLVAHSTELVLAGTETTSTALCRILHMLALYPPAQVRLRNEIAQALAASASQNGNLEYEPLMSLPYLDAVCKETLRLFAPAPYRHRRSIKESVIPFTDGTSLHVPANTEILVNIHCLNTDEALWGPDARKWVPERWMKSLPQGVTKIPGVWGNMLSFGGGPKSCIGFGFSLLEMKTVLVTILPVFRFSLPVQEEIEWRFGPTMTPSVKGEKSLHPRMPLRVEVL
ncbi:unnamed protein product [Peniophora sp. CBMAI 1063]|nr:unnamed protein product [Peniophora sp. CBMAI 1063]